MREIKYAILHCSASDHPQHDNIETIYKWHVHERGFSDVGYHYFIRKNGMLEIGRPIGIMGSHCKAMNMNHASIGICCSGEKEFTKEQFQTLSKLCKNLIDIFGILPENIQGHNHYEKNKTCPNYDVQKFKVDILLSSK